MAQRSTATLPLASWFALSLFALAVVAFWPIYVSRIAQVSEVFVHLHTVGVVAWMGLLVAQPALIRSRRFDLHRTLGRTTYVLVPYVVVTSALLARDRFHRMDAATFQLAGHGLYLASLATVLFVACYGLAIAHRRQAVPHSRYMIATALPLIDPIVARLLAFYTPVPDDGVTAPLIGYGLTDLILVGWLIAERGNPQSRRALLTLLPLFLLGHLGWFTFARSEAWFAFASWYAGAAAP